MLVAEMGSHYHRAPQGVGQQSGLFNKAHPSVIELRSVLCGVMENQTDTPLLFIWEMPGLTKMNLSRNLQDKYINKPFLKLVKEVFETLNKTHFSEIKSV